MSFNTEQIVQEIRAEFESMMLLVQNGKNATADKIERDVFRQVLDLGGQLMQYFFALRSEACLRTPITLEDGTELPYWCDKQRIYYSIFGKLQVMRPYFYAADKGSASPLDEELGLGADSEGWTGFCLLRPDYDPVTFDARAATPHGSRSI